MTIPSHLISLVVQCPHCARVHTASGLLHTASTPRTELYKGSVTTCAHAEVQLSRISVKSFRLLPTDQSNSIFGVMHIMHNRSAMTMGNKFIAPMLVGSVTLEETTVPAIVTPLYEHGNVSDYVCQNPSVDKNELVRQIALGLAYIHSLEETHGNMCMENIVITGTGEARITDVGVDSFWQAMVDDGSCPVPIKWMYKASEELEFGIRSTQADVHSFASTIYLMYTGKPMFPLKSANKWVLHLRQLVERGHKGVFGAHKPSGMGEDIWMIVNDCWARDPLGRPSMAEVVERLQNL